MSPRSQILYWTMVTMLSGGLALSTGCTGVGDDDVSTPTDSPTAVPPTPTPCVDADYDQSCASADCDENDAFSYPGANEIPYNGVDEDCLNGDLVDADGDGFNGGTGGVDCNDGDSAINPSATDVCGNNIDENCDGAADNQLACQNHDFDADGYSEDGSIGGAADCDDSNADISPGAPELYDGIDNNCDGQLERMAVLSRTGNVIVEGDVASQKVGFSVGGCSADAGYSINGDLFGDIVIGATGHGGQDRGGAALYFGGAGWAYPVTFSTAPVLFSETQTVAKAGHALGCVGDINYDGFMDFAVGAPEYDYSASVRDSGIAYVFLGQTDNWSSKSLSVGSSASIPGLFNRIMMGTGISGGNVNGDSFEDMLVGAITDADGWDFILPGGANIPPNINPQNLAKIEAKDTRLLGRSVAFSGDNNDDGYGDLISGGAYSADQQGYLLWVPGATYFRENTWYGVDFNGIGVTALEKYIELVGSVNGENVGWSSSGNGDVNGDGFPDFITADGKTLDASDPLAFLFFGGQNFLGGSAPDQGTLAIKDKANVKLYAGNQDFCPCSVALNGDLNGDGLSDLLVGVSEHLSPTVTNAKAGRVYVILGRSSWPSILTLDLDADYILDGATPDEQAGHSVAWVGDTNGDSFDDFLVGAPYADVVTATATAKDAGRAYVLYGRSMPTP